MTEKIDYALQRYAFVALLAAILFGASAPAAKLLLAGVSPQLLAGILYLGSGGGLCIARALLRRRSSPTQSEAPLGRRDMPWLAGAIAAGGIVAPVLLLWGLSRAGAAQASLLLNFEGVLTTLLAAVIFREAVGARVWLAMALMLAAGLCLAWSGAGGLLSIDAALPLAAIVGACLFWGLDNNLTRRIAGGDPVVIAMTKGAVAGITNVALAAMTGAVWPGAAVTVAALGVGFVSYGISLVLFIHALRHLGSARASAHFGTAPFIGALLSVLVLGEPFTLALAVALGLMALGTWLLLHERHLHVHTHEPLVHTHRHVHDAHHRHTHDAPATEPHVHEHRHDPLTHEHPHLPDLHHRHRH